MVPMGVRHYYSFWMPAFFGGPVRRDAKEVMAELLEKLSQKLDPQAPPAADAAAERQPSVPVPNRYRLTVGVDLGDKWSNY